MITSQKNPMMAVGEIRIGLGLIEEMRGVSPCFASCVPTSIYSASSGGPCLMQTKPEARKTFFSLFGGSVL